MGKQEKTYEELSTKKKLLIGGLGALTAPILSLLNLESEVLSNATSFNMIGIMLRIIVLFYIGAFVVWLHTDEHSPVKIFELGIAAPALLSLLVAGQIPGHTSHSNDTRTMDISLVSSAFAAESSPALSPEEENASATSSRRTMRQTLSEIYDGLVGQYGNYSGHKKSLPKKELGEKERRKKIDRPSEIRSP